MREKTLLVGETMGMFIANQEGPFESVQTFSFGIAGAEFNAAVGMERLGEKTGYYTKLGRDPIGKKILNSMEENHISTELIAFSEERTTGFMMKSKVSEGDPAIFYFRKGSAASTMGPEDIEALDLSDYKAVHMTGITPAISESARGAMDVLFRRAAQEHLLISFDPNLRPQLWPTREEMVETLQSLAVKSDIFLPGIKEIAVLLGDVSPEEAADYYLNRGVGTVVIKLGADGAYYATPEESGYVEGFSVPHIVDTVGAGDGFAAGFLVGRMQGKTMREAVRMANAVGAIQLTNASDNDGLPTREELEIFMREEG